MRISDWSSDVCSSDLGGGSGAFGAGAVAGTIEMASAGRAVLPLVSASAFYGSRDATELSAAVTPYLDDGFLSLSGRWDRGDGFWTTPDRKSVVLGKSDSVRVDSVGSRNLNTKYTNELY